LGHGCETYSEGIETKDIGRDLHGSEKLMPVIIYIGTFFMVTTLLVMGLGKIVALNKVADYPGDYEELVGGDIFAYVSFDVDPDWTITGADVLEDPDEGMVFEDLNDYQITFSAPVGYDGFRDVACYVVRNATEFPGVWENYRIEEPGISDYIIFYQSKRIYWGASYSYSHDYITFDEVADHIRPGFNYSDVFFKVWDGFTARLWTPEGTSLMDGVYANNYNLTIGLSYSNATRIMSTSPFALIGQFLTFSLPGMDWYISVLIAIPIYFAIGFLVLTLLSRFFPGIPGG